MIMLPDIDKKKRCKNLGQVILEARKLLLLTATMSRHTYVKSLLKHCSGAFLNKTCFVE